MAENSGGRKFYLLKNGVLKTFWFVLIATFVIELINAIPGVEFATDMIWKFTTTYAFIAAGGFFGYAGINAAQHVGLAKMLQKNNNAEEKK